MSDPKKSLGLPVIKICEWDPDDLTKKIGDCEQFTKTWDR